MEHDCSKVFVSAECIPQEVLYTPPRGGGAGGDFPPPAAIRGGRSPLAGGFGGDRFPGGGLRGSAPEAKNKCKIAL